MDFAQRLLGDLYRQNSLRKQREGYFLEKVELNDDKTIAVLTYVHCADKSDIVVDYQYTALDLDRNPWWTHQIYEGTASE